MKTKKNLVFVLLWVVTVVGTVFATLYISSAVRDGEFSVPLAVSDDPNDYLASSEMAPHTQALKDRAWSIVGSASSPKEKARRIYSSVVRNNYYDKDSVADGIAEWKDQVADVVYENRRSVCDGYVNEAVAMLRIVGVPARKVICDAYVGGRTVRHSYLVIYWDGAWHNTDPTFESKNIYRNGAWNTWEKYSDAGLALRWFDVADSIFSETHGPEIEYPAKYY